MSLAVITINNPSPALDHKTGEVGIIAQALHEAARAIQSQQGNATSGNIIGNGGATLGTWIYTPVASLP